jgi:hypothetical protein
MAVGREGILGSVLCTLKPGPRTRTFVSERAGKFWRVLSLSLSDKESTQPVLFFIAFLTFPLTTSITPHHHHGQRNVRPLSPAACTTLIFGPQKILRSPRSTTRRLGKRPQEGVPEKVNWSLCVLGIVDRAFYRALRLHPDKGGDPELFKEVTHA